jgi:hypothetical protein
MENILSNAIKAVQESETSFSKYITPNDVGATNAHQSGYHIHKSAWRLIFDEPGTKGSNKDLFVTIKWQDDFETNSRFIYYGTNTRNEYRLTRFGRGFPFLTEDNVGDLLVICKVDKEYYKAYVLTSDEDIEDFLVALNIAPDDINGIIPKQFEVKSEDALLQCFRSFVSMLKVEFPSTKELSNNARNCYNSAYKITKQLIQKNPDKEILSWLDAEYQLFKVIESVRYEDRIHTPFNSVEELIEIANTILNRRKSRAGKSLENHLEEIFRNFDLQFATQVTTEDNKKPDFLFPGPEAYLNPKFDSKKLVMLASKTTCKDRWRQVLNEADRIKTKHLFTLQQGISRNQLEEMYKYNVCLVVPQNYIDSFPREYRDKILSLNKFINYIQAVS